MSDPGVPDFAPPAGASGPQAGIFTPDAPAPPEPEKPAVDVGRLKKMFDDARTGNEQSRKDSELSRDYYDGYQLTTTERAALEARDQPPMENNRIRGAVNGILGVMELAKTDPRAYMRNPDQAPPPRQPVPAQPGQPQQQPQ